MDFHIQFVNIHTTSLGNSFISETYKHLSYARYIYIYIYNTLCNGVYVSTSHYPLIYGKIVFDRNFILSFIKHLHLKRIRGMPEFKYDMLAKNEPLIKIAKG